MSRYRLVPTAAQEVVLPVPARQLPTGTILVDSAPRAAGRTVAYCRVSGAGQRDDLERQAGRVAEECGRRGISLDGTVTEAGSGLDGNRVRLRELLCDPAVTMIVVEHRDRLARSGVEDLQAALSATGRAIIRAARETPGFSHAEVRATLVERSAGSRLG